MHPTRRLFGSAAPLGDCLPHDSFLERARVERARDNDGGARQALGGYLIARLIDRLMELDGSDEDAQAFAWQLEGCRRFVGDLPDTSEVSHLHGIIEAVNGDPAHRGSGVRICLSAYACFLEQEGRWSDALDVLALSSRMWEGGIPARELSAMALLVGRLNHLLARWDRAVDAYRLAEETALTVNDTYSVLRGRLGRGAVARGQDNLPQARALAEGVIAEASALGLADVLGMAYADIGAVLGRMGLRIESLQATYESFRRANDPELRAAVLGDLGVMLSGLGSYDAARCAFELVLEDGNRFQSSANARLELMQIEAIVGNRVAFERHRAEAKALTERMPPSMAVDYRYKTGAGFARFGQLERARTVWEEGRALAETHQLNEWYCKLDQLLVQLGERLSEAPGHGLTDLERSFGADAVVAGIGAGLRGARELARA